MRKKYFTIVLFVMPLLVLIVHSSYSTNRIIREYYPSGDYWVLQCTDDLTFLATDIINAEVLDSRTEWILTWLYRPDDYMCEERINRMTKIHTIHRLKVIEVFSGELNVGDILEVMQPGGRLGNNELIYHRQQHYVYGEVYVFFIRDFREFGFGHLPMTTVCAISGAYRIAPSSNEAEAFAEGIIPAFNANPHLASFTLEGTNEWNNVVVTVGDLMQIRYEAGLGPYPGYTPTPTPIPLPTGNPTQTGTIGTK